MKEKIEEVMGNLGLVLEKMSENFYSFDYEHLHCLLMFNEDDTNFVQFSVPCLVERGEIEDAAFNDLMNRFNRDFKYVKCYDMGIGLSLYYERDLAGESNLEEVVSRIIRCLAFGTLEAHKAIETEKKGNTDNHE